VKVLFNFHAVQAIIEFHRQIMAHRSYASTARVSGLEQSLIGDAVDQWPTRLRSYVRASSRHSEHTL